MTHQEMYAAVVKGETALSRDGAERVMQALLENKFTQGEIAEILTALHERGETAEEMAGFAAAMHAVALPVPLLSAERDALVDTCGTGGDGSGTFNISTAVALVATAAGVRVAKHGNKAITSRCGSADVLAALGIETEHTPESAAAALRGDGFAFLLAPRMHPAMRIVAPVRRMLPFRTVFNLLGPMTNPAGARRQVIGVYSEAAATMVADTLAVSGGMACAWVVHGAGGMDELSLAGESLVTEVRGTAVRRFVVVPGDAGLVESQDGLAGGNAAENAAILRRIFAGERGPGRDVVLLNAAAVLMVADKVKSLREGAMLAAAVIDNGSVTRVLEQLRRRTDEG